MKQKSNMKLWLVILLAFCVLLGFLSYGYLTKCILGASSISQYSLYCYLCVASNIRDFPTDEAKNQPEYKSSAEFTDGAGYYPPSNSINFKSEDSPEEIMKKAKKYFEALGFIEVENTDYEGSTFTGHKRNFKGAKSNVTVEIQQPNNSPLNQVIITEKSFTAKYNQ